MTLVGWSFLLAVASALVPLINIELYLGGVVATGLRPEGRLLLAVSAAAGQTIGKIVWYAAAARASSSGWMQRRLEKKKRSDSYRKWQEKADGRRWYLAGVIFLAASVGLPPLLVMAAVAGALRMNFWLFVATTFLGRVLRFWLVLAGVGMAFG